ncbi:recombinase RecT [uncultured Hyphomicrobium sp.]|uniref:recombinase RecT n=1 Tax=uncultured Hyphomicrobium sp. TaxID=194373 RepID=UPI0025D42E06|nr:recombinase RecT [uncultured Hyphomicrobium sp.]
MSTSTALSPYEAFSSQITTREEELATILPPHISPAKFKQTALIAVKNEPSLLEADRRSLHQAITEAAEDGLHPDGREGTITVFREKQRDGSHKSVAQWNPMIFGIRKRARELCDMVIDAQVVYANDKFIWHQGDDPRIEHTPASLGQDRGQPVGVYAIFRVGSTVYHREVMSDKEVNVIKGHARGSDRSLMWNKFWTEAWRKTVIRRGIKTVPSVPALEAVISRVDRDFDFGNGSKVVSAESIPSAQSRGVIDATSVEIADRPDDPPPPQQRQQHRQDAPIADEPPGEQGAPVAGGELIADTPGPEAQKPAQAPATGILATFSKAIGAAETPSALNGVWDTFEKKLKGEDRDKATGIFEARLTAIGG